MKINVIVKRGWVLERLARELVERISGVRINVGQAERRIDPRAAFNYYLPAKDFAKYPTAGRAIGFYTHGDNGLDLIPRFAACVAMNQTMAARLEALGAAHVTIIRPGTDAPPRPIYFGVIGRVYANGRKGEELVSRAVADGFKFIACGTNSDARALAPRQWPCSTPYAIEDREAFYAAIDYLVVTSTVEGGPMGVLEAIARGVPVIAPNVGWAWEFPVIRYEPAGEYSALRQVLEQLTVPPSWEQWGEAHARLFADLRKVA